MIIMGLNRKAKRKLFVEKEWVGWVFGGVVWDEEKEKWYNNNLWRWKKFLDSVTHTLSV